MFISWRGFKSLIRSHSRLTILKSYEMYNVALRSMLVKYFQK